MPNKTIKRVGMVFSGGPAPGANAVVSSCAVSFLNAGVEVYGFYDGYANLIRYDHEHFEIYEDIHYRKFSLEDVVGLRNSPGVIIRTSRANPGKQVQSEQDLSNPEMTAGLAAVCRGLDALGIDALISIGGDDTLRTANLLAIFQRSAGIGDKPVPLIHLPKTIDNDYNGIDFTFGYFTAVDFLAKELLDLRADAKSTNAWFICEVMGRKAGWLAYGTGIAGDANLIISPEDIKGRLDLNALADRIIDLIAKRERQRRRYGTVVIAEGLVEQLPPDQQPSERDAFGNLRLGAVELGKHLADVVSQRYREKRGKAIKVVGKQLGYEGRCSAPSAYDVVLGSQLGIGAYRALVEEKLQNVMVSVGGQFELKYIPFGELIDPDTLTTRNRLIQQGSDFYRLARFLESRTESNED